MLLNKISSRKYNSIKLNSKRKIEEERIDEFCEIISRTKISSLSGPGKAKDNEDEDDEDRRREVILEFESSDGEGSSEEFDIKKDILVNERSMY